MPTRSFEYLDPSLYYFDFACQAMRPRQIIDEEIRYYTKFNGCAGRGNSFYTNYLDKIIAQTRNLILDFVGKSGDEYAVVFTPNTTYGINLILTQLKVENYKAIYTTNKEHNSVFLPAMSFAKRHSKAFKILPYLPDNSIDFQAFLEAQKSILILNTASNIDGLSPVNLQSLVSLAKKQNNLVLLDATQSLAHQEQKFHNLDFDCLFASSHKMYGPSLGFMVIKKDLILDLDQYWVGGGTVQSLNSKGYSLISVGTELASRLEFGLQDYAAIHGLNTALKWLSGYKIKEENEDIDYELGGVRRISKDLFGIGPSKEAVYYVETLGQFLYTNLLELEKMKMIRILNRQPSSTISFIPGGIDSYELNKRLSENNVIARSGYLCCHYYLREVLKLPPVIRLSVGLHNLPGDIFYIISILQKELSN